MDLACSFPHAPKPARAKRTGGGISAAGCGSEGRGRVFHEAALQLIQAAGWQPGQDMPGEKVALVEMGIAAEDKGTDAHVHIAVELGEDLIGVARDGAAAA